MSEDNLNRCPKCDKGRLRVMKYRATAPQGRIWKTPKVKICQVCNTVISFDDKITFYQMDTAKGIQSA